MLTQFTDIYVTLGGDELIVSNDLKFNLLPYVSELVRLIQNTWVLDFMSILIFRNYLLP